MTSTDAAAPAAEAVVEPAPADAKAAEADGASAKAKISEDAGAPIKEVPKPDQPRLPKPDRRDLDKAVAELQETCDVKQARIEELKRAIETRRDARKTVGAGSTSTKTRIQELNQQFQARMVRGSPTPIAFAVRRSRRQFPRARTPRPPRLADRGANSFRAPRACVFGVVEKTKTLSDRSRIALGSLSDRSRRLASSLSLVQRRRADLVCRRTKTARLTARVRHHSSDIRTSATPSARS